MRPEIRSAFPVDSLAQQVVIPQDAGGVSAVFTQTCFSIGDMPHTRMVVDNSCFVASAYDRHPAAIVYVARATGQTTSED